MSDITREMFDRYYFPLFTPPAFIPVKGKGSRLWDQENREYIDFSGGIAVNSLGHCCDGVVEALTVQAQKLWHVSNLMTNEPVISLAKRLVDLTFADKAFFCNSGAEANEAAFKLARRYALAKHGEDKNEIISFIQSFHGRTLFTVSVGGQDHYSDGFGPKPTAIRHIPFNDPKALEEAISEKTCAVVMEPIQGEGGIIPADPDFMKLVRQLCDKNHALLIYDEVQTGCSRTGDFFAYMHTGVAPDILTTAKGLGGGFPIGAVLATDEVAAVFTPGVHGTTFGGNALACAVADKVISIISAPEFLEGVRAKSKIFFDRINDLGAKYDCFSQIRGRGLLIGAVLSDKYQGRSGDLLKICAKNRLLVLVAGKNVLRIAPALNIAEDEIEAGMKLLEKSVAEFVAG
ncbi:MAG: acetylornithine/succinyldiaminopimelate transaminase [Succinivibrionaceae bacterium]|nr:acetylornithine/succinyldiaminopimelate transaminase [Succinivibrionaceae bacterium]